MKFTEFCCVAACLATAALAQQPAAKENPDEAAIRKQVESYVAAFNKQDAKALAAHWSPDAVYLNPVTGTEVVGREAIEKEFDTVFKEAKGARLEVEVESLGFVSPNVAVEHGTARFISGAHPPEETSYTAVYVKRDGQWLLDRITEQEAEPKPHSEHLKELEWMIGTWMDEDEHARIETTCRWTKNRNFITRSFSVFVEDRIDLSGMQIVGWDPAAKRFRSWTFDSEGGFAEGTWTKKGDRWFIKKSGVLPGGRKATSVNIVTYVDENTFLLQSVARETDGEIQPSIDPVRVVRVQTSE